VPPRIQGAAHSLLPETRRPLPSSKMESWDARFIYTF
jgi:hypothetical protein